MPWWLTKEIESHGWLQVLFRFTQIKALQLQNPKFFIWSRIFFVDIVDQAFTWSLLINLIDQFVVCYVKKN